MSISTHTDGSDPVDAYVERVEKECKTVGEKPEYCGEKFQTAGASIKEINARFSAFKAGIRALLLYSLDAKEAIINVLRDDGYSEIQPQLGCIQRALDAVTKTTLLLEEETTTESDRYNARLGQSKDREILSHREYREFLQECVNDPLILLAPSLYFKALQKVLDILATATQENDIVNQHLRHIERMQWGTQRTVPLFIAPAFHYCAQQVKGSVFGGKSTKLTGEFLKSVGAFSANRSNGKFCRLLPS